jgi:hypothetical protein
MEEILLYGYEVPSIEECHNYSPNKRMQLTSAAIEQLDQLP